MNAQVKQDTAATLYYQPQEGRPTSATITIKTPGDEDLAVAVDAAAATIDSVNTTTDDDAGESEDDRRLVPLTATTSVVVGGRYLLTDTTGVREWVEVESVASGVSVTIKSDLEHDYTSGAAFVGTMLSYILAAENTTEALKDTDFRAEWTYVVAGITYIKETWYDVVRAPWYRAADQAGLEAANREVYAQAKNDDEPLEDILEDAWNDVLERIESKGWRPGLIIGMNRLARPTYASALLKLAEGGYRPAGSTDLDTWTDRMSLKLTEALDRALAGVTWYDRVDDAERGSDEEKPAMSSTTIGW
jgi:hypothetical protein